jgi:pyruvate formate lyase activating enzyme
MKGCPLSCWWCHNPEGISPERQTVDQIGRLGEMEFPYSEEVGRFYSVENILDILEKERIFFQESGGGVTFSGGEPLMQPLFLMEALKACKAGGFHTAVDTSGYSPAESLKSVLNHTDLFLFDIKHFDDNRHIRLTGESNKIILSNLKMIISSGKDLMIRIPVIPGKNDDAENMIAMRKWIIDNKCDNIKKINLLPFHRIGRAKYKKFNIPYRMNDTVKPSAERMIELKEFFLETGIKVKIGG